MMARAHDLRFVFRFTIAYEALSLATGSLSHVYVYFNCTRQPSLSVMSLCNKLSIQKKISVMSACIISFAASLAGVLKILDNDVDNDENAVGFSRDDCQSGYGS